MRSDSCPMETCGFPYGLSPTRQSWPEEMVVTFHKATVSLNCDAGGAGSAVTLDLTPGAHHAWSPPACESIPAMSRCLQQWQPSGTDCEDLIFDVPEFVVAPNGEEYVFITKVIRTMVASGPFVVFGNCSPSSLWVWD